MSDPREIRGERRTDTSRPLPIASEPDTLPDPFPSRSAFPVTETTQDATIDRSDVPRHVERGIPPLKVDHGARERKHVPERLTSNATSRENVRRRELDPRDES